jgi:hypothetical protein
MIYTALCIGQVGGGWALEIESFLGPVKWHQADFDFQGPTPSHLLW